jgi:hypothetical protein
MRAVLISRRQERRQEFDGILLKNIDPLQFEGINFGRAFRFPVNNHPEQIVWQ